MEECVSSAHIFNRGELTYALTFLIGKFYVCAGEKEGLGPWYHDFHCLDLNELDGWRKLPDCPVPTHRPVRMTGLKMGVDESTDKAYFFIGQRSLLVFDLQSERWSRVNTTYNRGAWPIPNSNLVEFTMAVYRGKLYVFSGSMHSQCSMGCSLWMVLDLKTLVWKKLSGCGGDVEQRPDASCPGPRRHPAMWVDEKRERIWVMFGEAALADALAMQQPNGAPEGYAYDDCWSWDVNGESWRRERVAGNVPCRIHRVL